MLNVIPDEIKFDAEKLHIRWKDGHPCSYTLLALRRDCPCAQCRGGHSVDSIRTTDGIASINLISWKKVGRYALSFVWSDGHDLGIYTYDELRRACDEGGFYGVETPH